MGRIGAVDFELLYDLWLELGTQPKVSAELARRGIFGRGGKPYSIQAVGYNSRIWRCEHEKAAREKYEKKFGPISDDEWYPVIINDSRYLMASSRGRYDRWVENNPDVVKYAQENQ